LNVKHREAEVSGQGFLLGVGAGHSEAKQFTTSMHTNRVLDSATVLLYTTS